MGQGGCSYTGRTGGAKLTDMPTWAYDDAKGSAKKPAKIKERNFMIVVLIPNPTEKAKLQAKKGQKQADAAWFFKSLKRYSGENKLRDREDSIANTFATANPSSGGRGRPHTGGQAVCAVKSWSSVKGRIVSACDRDSDHRRN